MCAQPYDYVGAPWLTPIRTNVGLLSGGANGGFSLRRVDSFLRVLTADKGLARRCADRWRDHCRNLTPAAYLRDLPKRFLRACGYHNGARWLLEHYPDGEDVFWSHDAPLICPEFRVAPRESALRFAFERDPAHSLTLTNGQMPFGCHAWERYDRSFWDPFLLNS